ncbi:class I SAM-dependent methyltransferase [Hydrogenimonas sp.]
MRRDKKRWDEKYRTSQPPQKPSQFLIKHIQRLKGKEVLDIAAGMGRHAKALASHGCRVDAIEYSDIALEALANIEGVHPIEMDLDNICNLRKKYDAILCFNYLNRDLYPFMTSHLKQGGTLLFETFVDDKANEDTPSNKSFLLEKNELLRVFCNLYIFDYSERFIRRNDGKKNLVASLAASKTLFRGNT